jgi:hypothetical protein
MVGITCGAAKSRRPALSCCDQRRKKAAFALLLANMFSGTCISTTVWRNAVVARAKRVNPIGDFSLTWNPTEFLSLLLAFRSAAL